MDDLKKSIVCDVLYLLNSIMIIVSTWYVETSVTAGILLSLGIFFSWKIGKYEGENNL